MKSLFCFLFLMFVSERACAQNAGADNYEKAYHDKIPLLQDIAMGGFFEDPPLNIIGNPRYQKPAFVKGDLLVNGILYRQVQLSYDIYADELLTFHPVFAKKISLQPEKIGSFRLEGGEKFVRRAANPGYLFHRNGYYQLVWDGNVKVLAKHRKVTKKSQERNAYTEKFVHKTDFFMEKDQRLYAVKNSRQAVKLLGLERKAIRKASKKQGLNFRNDPAEYLRFLGEFHQQLHQSPAQ